MGCGASVAQAPASPPPPPKMFKAGLLGILRLDYGYPPAPGDIDSPLSYDYKVLYRVIPGLTFEMCQSGMVADEVQDELKTAVDWLISKGVNGITGDCGFMMWLQPMIRRMGCTKIPVFMSSLVQLPAITRAYADDEKIAIFTANGKTLDPMKDLISDECGIDTHDERYIIVGCEDVPGFEAVALGEKVDVPKVTPGIVEKAKNVLAEHPTIRAILLECTELPPYSDALRKATGIPVYDAITSCNMFMAGVQDNPRFGINDWQAEFDGVQDDYMFGKHLTLESRARAAKSVVARIDLREVVFVLPGRSPLIISRAAPHSWKLFFPSGRAVLAAFAQLSTLARRLKNWSAAPNPRNSKARHARCTFCLNLLPRSSGGHLRMRSSSSDLSSRSSARAARVPAGRGGTAALTASSLLPTRVR
ncbi:unnamed protein product [Prorocentrum cordatum]|uniref:Dimethylpropiothetin dethiomethylase n=1 Tax=Prorocentrum cordatum TaxID=2364126 RepID=A0ABN9UFB5_9DINO|nr:unnamed protein product [Polarella glacialis]